MLARIHAISHSLRTRLFAAVLLLPLVAVATATSGVWLKCRITGELLSACCCPPGEDTTEAVPITTVSAADCCDRVVREVTPPKAELSVPQRSAPPHATLVPLDGADHRAGIAPQSHVLWRAECRARVGPPSLKFRLLSKSTFLI